MSKQSQAKEAQGYTTEPKNCGNCVWRKFDLELPAWMQAPENIGHYGERHKVEVRQRCGLGGFAIKKTATCQQWRAKDPA